MICSYHVQKFILTKPIHLFISLIPFYVDEKDQKQKGSSISLPSVDTKYECISAYTRIEAEVGIEAQVALTNLK